MCLLGTGKITVWTICNYIIRMKFLWVQFNNPTRSLHVEYIKFLLLFGILNILRMELEGYEEGQHSNSACVQGSRAWQPPGEIPISPLIVVFHVLLPSVFIIIIFSFFKFRVGRRQRTSIWFYTSWPLAPHPSSYSTFNVSLSSPKWPRVHGGMITFEMIDTGFENKKKRRNDYYGKNFSGYVDGLWSDRRNS